MPKQRYPNCLITEIYLNVFNDHKISLNCALNPVKKLEETMKKESDGLSVFSIESLLSKNKTVNETTPKVYSNSQLNEFKKFGAQNIGTNFSGFWNQRNFLGFPVPGTVFPSSMSTLNMLGEFNEAIRTVSTLKGFLFICIE